MSDGRLSVSEVARRIADHLKRLENDNVRNDRVALRFWDTHAFQAGRYVGVRYVGYQGHTNLTRDEALRYLEALEGGFKGRHFEALEEPNTLDEGDFDGKSTAKDDA